MKTERHEIPVLEEGVPGHFQVRGVLAFDTVTDLLEAAHRPFAEAQEVHVDLAGVERADSAGVALLVEWVHEARQRQQGIHFLNVPAQMLAIARVSGLDSILPLERNGAD